MALPKLYVNKICPFAQRAMIVAAHKNFQCETIHISLADMPEWYKKEINPREEVPALQLANGVNLSESALIAQYIDSVTEPRNALFPDNAEIRNKIRDFSRRVEAAQWACYGLLMGSEESREERLAAAVKELGKVTELLSTESSFAVGSTFTMADVNFGPFIIRFAETLRAYSGIDLLTQFPRIAAFRDQILTVPAVASTTPAPEFFIDAYSGYANGKNSTNTFTVSRLAGCPFSERLDLTVAYLTEGPNAPKYLKSTTFAQKVYADADAASKDGAADLPILQLTNGKTIDNSIEAVTFLAERFTDAKLLPESDDDVFIGRFYVDALRRVTEEIIGDISARKKGFHINSDALVELKRAEGLFVSSGPYLFGALPTIYDLIVLPVFHRADLLMGSDAFAAVAPKLAGAIRAARADAILGGKLVAAAEFVA